jgi:UDP-3-O-[3-hydroxymyristoyl] glucosamine N-acyltransferase
MRVRELAAMLQAEWEGDGEREIRRVAGLDSAGPDELSFVANRKAAKEAASSPAGALIVPLDYPNDGQTVIRVAEPRSAVAHVIARLRPKRETTPGVHPTAILGPGVSLGIGVSIGPYVTVGAGVRIGEGTSVGGGCSIGDYVQIGQRSTLHPNVSIYYDVTIGDRVVLHSGCVLGADGFGFVLREGAYHNFPQVGRVEIGNDVEIGANSCVDRAALDATVIGDGAKLDNMVHIGHNCRVGRHVVIAAQTGLAGGVVIEDYAVIGGQVGIGDKARIESRAVLGSGCGVLTSKVIRSGQVVWGTPARPLKDHLAQLAALARLPGIRKEWAELKKRLP